MIFWFPPARCRDPAFTGDGTNPAVMVGACKAVKANAGFGIPTVKPWDAGTIAEKMALVRATGAFAVAWTLTPPVCRF